MYRSTVTLTLALSGSTSPSMSICFFMSLSDTGPLSGFLKPSRSLNCSSFKEGGTPAGKEGREGGGREGREGGEKGGGWGWEREESTISHIFMVQCVLYSGNFFEHIIFNNHVCELLMQILSKNFILEAVKPLLIKQ